MPLEAIQQGFVQHLRSTRTSEQQAYEESSSYYLGLGSVRQAHTHDCLCRKFQADYESIISDLLGGDLQGARVTIGKIVKELPATVLEGARR